MEQSSCILTECEEAFALKYIDEIVRLEMQGPAHKLADENDFSDIDFAKLMGAFPQVQGKLVNEQLQGADCVIPTAWPWPGMSSTEITDLLRNRRQSTSNVHGPEEDDGQCSIRDSDESKED